jgi:hypothetical protein
MARDDFSLAVKTLLARRVGMRCSNPNCRKPTSGPDVDPNKAVNIGVASHITAASRGGPRYDAASTPEQRQSPENGIWLCQNCGKLIDDDTRRYPAELLRSWKRVSEEAALLAVETSQSPEQQPRINDVELVRFFAQCFDRNAFKDPFNQEGSMEAFDKAMEDTLTAISTGCLRSRDGAVLFRAWGKAFLQNPKWREQMDVIADLLGAIRSRYQEAKKTGGIHVSPHRDGTEFYCIHDHSLAEWMDVTRTQIMQIFAGICGDAGVVAPKFPRPRPRHW